MKRAREENKPVFIDFTGYTCTNCRYMEGAVFPLPEVKSRLEKMVLVTAYTDGTDDVHDQQRQRRQPQPSTPEQTSGGGVAPRHAGSAVQGQSR